MPSASAQAPLAGQERRGPGLRRIASPKFVNGGMGLPNVNSGRGPGVPPTLGEQLADGARPPVNSGTGLPNANSRRSREVQSRQNRPPPKPSMVEGNAARGPEVNAAN